MLHGLHNLSVNTIRKAKKLVENNGVAKIGNVFLDFRLTGRSTEDYVYKQSD